MTAEIRTDTKLALRVLARSPGFTVAAIVVLALGVGANASIFSAVKATLLSPPPYPEPERLVLLDLTNASAPATPGAPPAESGPRPFPWSYPKFEILSGSENLPADPLAAYAVRNLTLTGAGDAARLGAEIVTPDYLEVVGLSPAVGRDLDADDDAPGAEPVVVLGHGLWRERFGGDPAVVGRTVTLNGEPATVVGVGPAGFRGLSGEADLWVPVHTGAALIAPFLVRGGQAHWLQAVGRLPAGATLEALRARMAAVGEAAEAAYPDSDPTVDRGGGARSLLRARTNPEARRSLLVLSAAAGLLLLVACANLAGLLVARAGSRSRETAVRVALGAGRWRASRTFLLESVLLSLAGGALALVVARFGVEAVTAAWPERFLDGAWNLRFADPRTIELDPGVLTFAVGLAVATGLASGLVPVLASGLRDPGARLRAGPSGALGRGRRGARLRGGLVTLEVAVTLVLLVGAGLLFRSLAELQSVDRGIDVERLLVFEYSIPRTSSLADDAVAFHRAYLERLRALPGVESATLGCAAPLDGHCMITMVRRAGATVHPEGSRPEIGVDFVDHAYFETLGVPLVRGRTFGPDDRADSPPVVVLNRTAARTLFPRDDALGRKIAMGVSLTPEGSEGAEVIGIVGDVLYDTPERGVRPEAYFSVRQQEGGSTVFLRTAGEPLALVPAARAALADLDPTLPLFGVRTLRELESGATADTRVLAGLLAAFAGLALLLAATGVWAVVAFAVQQRTREVGLRVALGARPREVVGLLVRRGVVLGVAGVALGGALAWAGSRVLGGLLYGIGATDPATFAAGALFLLAVTAGAAWLPARRAAGVDPMEALRAE